MQKRKFSDIIYTESEKNDSGVVEEMRRLLTLPLNDSKQIVKSKKKNLSVANIQNFNEVSVMKNTNVMEKKTQVQMFSEIINMIHPLEGSDEYVEFLRGRIDLLLKQGEKAKERKAKKAAERGEDEMTAAIAAQLDSRLKTRDEITSALELDFPEITKAKVTARLSKLVEQGVAGKLRINVGEGKRCMAYALAQFIPSDEDE